MRSIFYKTSNSILFLLLRELWHKYDVETLLRSEISFANVNCGISLRNGRRGGVRGTCAALGAWRPNGPPREGRAPARPGDLCTWAGLRLQSVNTESAEVPGTRESFVCGGDYMCPPHPSSFHPYRGGARSRATNFTDLRTSTHTPIGF